MNERPLTPKQERFAILSAHKSQADAYREAYDVENESNAAIYVDASRLADHPKVVLRRAQEIKRMEDDWRESEIASARYIVEKAAEIVDSDVNPASARVQALSLLAKRHPEFKEPISDSKTLIINAESMSVDELRAMRNDLLKALGGPSDATV